MNRRHLLSVLARALPLAPLAAQPILAAATRSSSDPDSGLPWQPDDVRDPYLGDWEDAARTLLTRPEDRLQARLLSAARRQEKLAIRYHGTLRDVTPLHLFRADGYDRTYCTAYCHTRNAGRTFRLDRIELA